jgi:hypothetical protein
MRGKLFVWLVIALAVLGLAGYAALKPPAVCDADEEQTAVFLTLLDDNDAPLERVAVRYRLNDNAWTALPEPVNGRAFIPGAGGVYQIQATKAAYETAEITVAVPAAEPPTCRVPTQSVALQLAAAVCPTEPEPLTIQIASPHEKESARVTAVMSGGRRLTLDCQSDEADCQTYQLPLTETGQRQLALDGLPAIANAFVEDGVINYAWAPYEVYLTHGRQTVRLAGERANSLTLDFTVVPDEAGCAQPDLQTLAVALLPEPDSDAPFPPLSGSHLGGLLMTDLSAEACRQPPEMKSVLYELTVPAGTPIDQVGLLYWLDEEWREGECDLENGRLLCAAQFPQPLIRQPYAVKALAAGEEYIITQLPFGTLCILFR